MRTLDTDSLLSDPGSLWLHTQEPTEPVQADPLSMALPWLVRHLGVAAAVEAVVGPVDGFPGQHAPGADSILPALRRIGFDARMAQRPLAELREPDLPAVLLLRNGDACVLTRRHTDSDGQALCTVVMPGPQLLELLATDDDIAAEYSGVALLVSRPKPPLRVAGRAPFGQVKRAEPSSLSALAAAIQSASQAMVQAERGELSAADAEPVPVPARPARPATRLPAPEAAELLASGADLASRPGLARGSATGQRGPRTAVLAVVDDGPPTATPLPPQADAAVAIELSFLKSPASDPRWRLAAAAWRLRLRHGLDRVQALWPVLRNALSARLQRAGAGLRGMPLLRGRKASATPDSQRPGPAAQAPMAALPTMARRLLRTTTSMTRPLSGWRADLPLGSLCAMPLWLGMSAVCLLIGTPLAWAQMLSLSSLQAAATLAPLRLRDALAADQDRAVLALAGQRPARPGRAGSPPDRQDDPVLELPAPASTQAAAAPAAADPGSQSERSSGVRARAMPRRVPRMH